ncbi:hypothetical protein [Psychroserpens jangbogonensis]|uniref:hypothetical protein n=1 Tax=Psychroserpens jangbogonensis TaxID=1484460 RepID=UPI00053E1A48|nr:hypothetical protein [Psychroserpens jangbogonensis]
MIKTIVLLLFVVQISQTTIAQEHIDKEPGFELVFSGLSIYNTETEISDFATEIHLTYWTTHKWAFGVGYTLVFEEDNKIGHEVAALVSHKPWSFLTVNTGPSISLPNSHKDTEISTYLESEFAFKIGNIHTGPTAGILVGEDFRYFGGLHISYEF